MADELVVVVVVVEADRGVGREEVEEGFVEAVSVLRCRLVGVRFGDRRGWLDRRKEGERVAGSLVRREVEAMGVLGRLKEKWVVEEEKVEMDGEAEMGGEEVKVVEVELGIPPEVSLVVVAIRRALPAPPPVEAAAAAASILFSEG